MKYDIIGYYNKKKTEIFIFILNIDIKNLKLS